MKNRSYHISTRLKVVVTLLASVLIAGCGGGGESSVAETTGINRSISSTGSTASFTRTEVNGGGVSEEVSVDGEWAVAGAANRFIGDQIFRLIDKNWVEYQPQSWEFSLGLLDDDGRLISIEGADFVVREFNGSDWRETSRGAGIAEDIDTADLAVDGNRLLIARNDTSEVEIYELAAGVWSLSTSIAYEQDRFGLVWALAEMKEHALILLAHSSRRFNT